MMKGKSFEFDLTVTGIRHEQAYALLKVITAMVDALGGVMAGGFVEGEEEGEDGEED